MLRGHRKVRFIKRALPPKRSISVDDEKRLTAMSTDSSEASNVSAKNIPPWMSIDDLIGLDDFETESSEAAFETATHCLPLLWKNANVLPDLQRAKHIRYVCTILEGLPSGFASLDASRPWIFYWSLLALHLLGEDLTRYREP